MRFHHVIKFMTSMFCRKHTLDTNRNITLFAVKFARFKCVGRTFWIISGGPPLFQWHNMMVFWFIRDMIKTQSLHRFNWQILQCMGDTEKLHSEQHTTSWALFGESMIYYGFTYFARMYLKYNKEILIPFKQIMCQILPS